MGKKYEEETFEKSKTAFLFLKKKVFFEGKVEFRILIFRSA